MGAGRREARCGNRERERANIGKARRKAEHEHAPGATRMNRDNLGGREATVARDKFKVDSELAARVEELLAQPLAENTRPSRVVEIPTRYGGEDGPDLEFVARHNGLSPAEVIAIHTSRPWRVFMLGFTPGFPYIGPLPPSIAAPRLSTPRAHVPIGSVGIAGRQTGIYPRESPGGWQLIGRTDVVLFDPTREPPVLLMPGDQVRFVQVAR